MQAVQQSFFSVPSIKTPLRYVGGKSKVARFLYSYMPAGVTEMVSPFIGGGGFELFIAGQDIRVHGYDNFPPLVNFWHHMLTQPSAMVDGIKKYIPPHEHARELYDSYYDIPALLDQAVAYWALNKGSFSAMTLSSRGAHIPRTAHKHCKVSHFENFRNFQSPCLSVGCADFRESLARHPDTFAYCDPPYVDGERYYGDGNSGRFPHEALSDILKRRAGDFMLSYNDNQLIRDLYPASEFRYITPQWTYSINNMVNDISQKSNELLIMPR